MGHGAAQLQGAPFTDCVIPGLAQDPGGSLGTVPWGREEVGMQAGKEETQLPLQGGG